MPFMRKALAFVALMCGVAVRHVAGLSSATGSVLLQAAVNDPRSHIRRAPKLISASVPSAIAKRTL
jgi:hypothetical protein